MRIIRGGLRCWLGLHWRTRIDNRTLFCARCGWWKHVALLAVAALSVGCSAAEPDAGQEAVLVRKPWFFGAGGCGPEVVKTGLVWTAPSTSPVLVNMQPRQQEFNFDDLFTSDGVPLAYSRTPAVLTSPPDHRGGTPPVRLGISGSWLRVQL